MNRRQFIGRTLLTGAGAALAGWGPGCSHPSKHNGTLTAIRPRVSELEELSVADLQRGLATGRFTSVGLTREYLRRIAEIDRGTPGLNSIIELNPEAMAIARELDRERSVTGARGPLHGIPILIKDNIDTRDQMTTTAGSLALEGSIAPRDSFIVQRLRAAGAVILGKTNLSEWANFRGSRSISGWSGRGGQTRNPYCLACSPSGSSSGSGAAVSASLCAVAIGTETNGSIVSPSSCCGIVGIKPTVGLVSRSGIIPISSSQDTAGPMARTVADAAVMLGAIVGPDPRDPTTSVANANAHRDYTQFLDAKALEGARIGVARSLFQMHRRVDPVFENALAALKRAGAEMIDPVKLPSRSELARADYEVMVYEFKHGLNAYFASLGSSAPIKTVEELIAFNEAHADRELRFFGQEILIEAQGKGGLTDAPYLDAREKCRKWSGALNSALEEQRLDAVVAPTAGPAGVLDWVHGDRGMGGSSTYAAVSGFPNITVPCGDVFGLPVGLSFFGRPWTEPRLIALAYAFEQATLLRRPPRFLSAVEV